MLLRSVKVVTAVAAGLMFVAGCGGSGSAGGNPNMPHVGDRWTLLGTVTDNGVIEPLTETVFGTTMIVDGKSYFALSHSRIQGDVGLPPYGELLAPKPNGETPMLGWFNGDEHQLFDHPKNCFYFAFHKGEFNYWQAKVTPYGQGSSLRYTNGEFLETKLGRLWTWKVIVGTQLGPVPEDVEAGTMWYAPSVNAYVKVDLKQFRAAPPYDVIRETKLDIENFIPVA